MSEIFLSRQQYDRLVCLCNEVATVLNSLDPAAAVLPKELTHRSEPIESLGLARRPTYFWRVGINTLADLLERTADELLEEFMLGPRTLEQIRKNLQKKGLYLKGEVPKN